MYAYLMDNVDSKKSCFEYAPSVPVNISRHCYTGQVAEYHVENFGCRASQADGDAIAATLEGLGALPSDGLTQASVVVVNTCSVTAEADRDARAYIRLAQRANPQARIVVTGCYAQRAPEEVAALPGVFAVVGNSHKDQVASVALNGTPLNLAPISNPASGFVPLADLQAPTPTSAFRTQTSAFCLTSDIFAHTEFQMPSLPASVLHRLEDAKAAHRTRPSLKIQDGCGNRCTFCIIPSTRGNSRSQSRKNVLAAVQEFVEAGGKELVISGINLGRWGRDLTPQDRLEDLLAEIFETTALPRLRISSIEPMDWMDGILALLRRWGTGEHPRFARHVHLPLQSGSDGVLRRMHRRYRPWHYAERLAAVRSASPDATLGADVMVGFPGETDAEFQECHDFIAAQPLTYLHLFPFSARPGTPGWEMHRQSPVGGVAVRERMAVLRTLIDRKNRAFRSSFVGRELSALTLVSDTATTGRQRSIAMTDNFLPVEIDGVWAPNALVTAQITAVATQGLQAIGVTARKPATSGASTSSLETTLECYTHEARRSLAHLEAAHR
jgi:threonylcarbamoyladenosine tRNA methylthiotransferase MtaB